MIKWESSPYYLLHPDDCQLFWGPHRISPSLKVKSGQFWWPIGKGHDGSPLPLGDHKIILRTPNYETPIGPRYVLTEGPDIRVTAPAHGANLMLGKPYKITWTFSKWFNYTDGTAMILCGPHEIAHPVTVRDGSFQWIVGKKKDGSFMPPGKYNITIETADTVSGMDPSFTIVALEFMQPVRK